jgi:hypothetical protein
VEDKTARGDAHTRERRDGWLARLEIGNRKERERQA